VRRGNDGPGVDLVRESENLISRPTKAYVKLHVRQGQRQLSRRALQVHSQLALNVIPRLLITLPVSERPSRPSPRGGHRE
jgi:hypothetical protein